MTTEKQTPESPESLTSEADIEALVGRAYNGDTEAAWELLQRYRPLLIRTVRRAYLTRHGPIRLFDWEDVWQEARYAFLLALRRYEPDRRVAFGGYVKAMLPWHFHSLQRSDEPEIVSLTDSHLTVLADPDGDFVAAIALRDVFGRLSLRQAQVLEAVYLRDQPAAEIARHLGVTTRAVERTRRRAEAELRGLLTLDDSRRLRLL